MMFPKLSLWRSRKLLEAVRAFPCQHCGADDGTVCAAHSNQGRDGKGKAIKAHDYRVAALCNSCHTALDQGRDGSRDDRVLIWEDAHRKTIALLFESGVVCVK